MPCSRGSSLARDQSHISYVSCISNRVLYLQLYEAEAEAPILWPPGVKSWLFSNDTDTGNDWRQEEKGMTEDEMVWWHHQFNGHEFEQAPGDGEGQGSLVCFNLWGHKESYMTEQLNNQAAGHSRRYLQDNCFYFFNPPHLCSIKEPGIQTWTSLTSSLSAAFWNKVVFLAFTPHLSVNWPVSAVSTWNLDSVTVLATGPPWKSLDFFFNRTKNGFSSGC